MNWHRRPELLDRLAAEYVLGTLASGALRRFEAVMQAHPLVAQAVMQWQSRLLPLDGALDSMPAGEALWLRIAGRAFGDRASVQAAAAHAMPWWRRWLGAAPAAALSFGLALGLVAPMAWQSMQPDARDTQLPESYVGVLATRDGAQGLIVSSLRHGKTVDIKVMQPLPAQPGRAPVLWSIDAKGVAQAVGALPALERAGFVSVRIERTSEQTFSRAVELAVSVEPIGALPASPSTAFEYRGLCGKLWRAKAPA